MGLNIKNERTTALVRELASRTGESQTAAVEKAVLERLERLDAREGRTGAELEERRLRSAALLKQLRDSLSDSQREALREAQDELFDENGLPG